MEIFTDKNECCGCTACENACPKNAITMQTDDEGFLYPVIDDALCVNCGICKNVCAFQNGCKKSQIQKSFAVKHKDADTRRASRSGGAFIAISDYILEKGGSVYGAAFDDDFFRQAYSRRYKRTAQPYAGFKVCAKRCRRQLCKG